ncbi:MAG: EamA family transporter [bacterium]|nr:EamA family transporter [bacterium]
MTHRTTEPVSRIGLIAAFAAVYLIWGSTYLAIRIGIETIPPFLMAGVRFLAAGLPLYVVLRLRGVAAPTAVEWRSAAVVGTLMLAGGNGLVTWAERSIASSIAAVIIATVPLWMTSLEVWPFRSARVSLRAVIGLTLGLIGVVVLVAPGGEMGSVALLPSLALVVAALSWSVGSLLSRSMPLPRTPLMTAALQMTTGGAVLVGWGTVAGEWPTLELAAVSTRSLVALLYLITFGSIVALGAYVWLMRVTSAAAVSTYAFVNPIVAVILGWALAGEVLGGRALVATGLIVGAVVFLQGSRLLRGLGRAPKPAAPCESSLELVHTRS